jgi:hypothetical protein
VIALIVIAAVVLLLAIGFRLTRGARGARPLDAEGRAVDAKAHISPMGNPMSFDDDFKRPRP